MIKEIGFCLFVDGEGREGVSSEKACWKYRVKFAVSLVFLARHQIFPRWEKCGKINLRRGGDGGMGNGGDRGGSIGLIVNSRRIRCSSEFSATANEYRVHC